MKKPTKAGLEARVRELESDNEHASESARHYEEQMKKAVDSRGRLLRAVQRSRAAERELFAACADTDNLPDEAKSVGWGAFASWANLTATQEVSGWKIAK